MFFLYRDYQYPVVIIRKGNKNTYIRIKDNSVIVTTSYFTTDRRIIRLLDDNRKSIERMIDKVDVKERNRSVFQILGVPYQKEYKDVGKVVVDFNRHIVICRDDLQLEKYLRNMALELFNDHLMKYYYAFEESITFPSLKIRKMTSRWGVCNTKTFVITLNFNLIYYELDCLDYVIVHELSHLLEGNHSSSFWKIVEKYYPNYKEVRKKMRLEC